MGRVSLSYLTYLVDGKKDSDHVLCETPEPSWTLPSCQDVYEAPGPERFQPLPDAVLIHGKQKKKRRSNARSAQPMLR